MFLKRLSPRTLFSLTPSSSPSPYSIFIAQCSTSSPSHLTYHHAHSHPDSRNVRVSVWWDLDNCTVPPGVNVVRGAQAITAAIESSGIKGPIQITAFGDMLRHAWANEESLSSAAINFTGINFTHVPHGGKNIAHRSLFTDLTCWVLQNPPPAHLFLIIADEDYVSMLHQIRMDNYNMLHQLRMENYNMLHQLRMKNYNILLATKEPVHCVLRSAATIVWNWDALVRAENLPGYFNRPPNCPCYHGWCDRYEGPLHEVFFQDSFWKDMQTFFKTDIGSFIISESKTRDKLAYHLRKYGPSVLKSVSKIDVLLMVDMLLAEKKWVLKSP